MSSDDAAEQNPASLINALSTSESTIEPRQDDPKTLHNRSPDIHSDEQGKSQDGGLVSESLVIASVDCETSSTFCSAFTVGLGICEPKVLGRMANHREIEKASSSTNDEEESRHYTRAILDGTLTGNEACLLDRPSRPLEKVTVASSCSISEEKLTFGDPNGNYKFSPGIYRSSSHGTLYLYSRSSQSKGAQNEPGRSSLRGVRSISSANLQSVDYHRRPSVTQDGHCSDGIYSPSGGEKLKHLINAPSIVIQQTFASESERGGGIGSTNDSVALSFKCKSEGGKSLKAGGVRPIFGETKSMICKEELDHKDSVVEKALRIEYDDLTKKLNIDVEPDPLCCIASTIMGLPCKNKIAKSNRIETRRILKLLTTFDLFNDHDVFSTLLENLAYLVHCKGKHQPHATQLLHVWKKTIYCSIQGINKSSHLETNLLLNSLGTQQINGSSLQKPSQSLRNLGAQVLEVKQNDLYKEEKHVRLSGNTSKFSSAERAAIRTFVPFDPRAKSKTRIENAIYNMVMRNLLPSEESSGSIYIYWFPGNFGLLKIGLTKRDVNVRLKEWEKKCGHETHLAYPISQNEMQLVPHVHRVEALAHAELRDCRKREVRCEGCKKPHVEWFEKSLPDAIAIVQKWSAWIRTEPYEGKRTIVWDPKQNCDITKSVWKLKAERKTDLQALSKASPALSSPSSSLIPQRPGRRRPSSGSLGSFDRSRSEQSRRRSSRLSAKLQKSNLADEDFSFPAFSQEFLSTKGMN